VFEVLYYTAKKYSLCIARTSVNIDCWL